jgi:hypothetical protein
VAARASLPLVAAVVAAVLAGFALGQLTGPGSAPAGGRLEDAGVKLTSFSPPEVRAAAVPALKARRRSTQRQEPERTEPRQQPQTPTTEPLIDPPPSVTQPPTPIPRPTQPQTPRPTEPVDEIGPTEGGGG